MRLARILTVAAALAFVPFLIAQEPPNQGPKTAAAEPAGEPGVGWKTANFAILVAFLGYLTWKHAGKFYESRNEQIQRSLVEAARAKQEADQRVAEMELRIASLAGEIEAMREKMRREITAEGERITLETERHIRRIQEDAQQEIETMIKTARRELKMYSAELAIRLAEEQLQGRITRDVENNLVSSFIADLRTRSGENTNN